MDVLVIGNGFDLAHNLSTLYKNFLDFCNDINTQQVIDENYSIYAECCRTNLWMKHFIKRQANMGDNWIDLEKEIYLIIVELLKKIPALRAYNKDDVTLAFEMELQECEFEFSKINSFITISYNDSIRDRNEYYANKELKFYTMVYRVFANSPKAFIKFLYNQLREFTKVFNNYLIEEVLNKIKNENKDLLILNGIERTINIVNMPVLSFNYTDTCERLYKEKIIKNFNRNMEVIYVHGKVSERNTCNLVLGTYSFDNDAYIENTKLNIPVDFNIFKKYHQRHKYETIEAYQDLLLEIKNDVPTFHVIGHSLDETDHLILKHLFQANKNAWINIYYHNEETQEKLINNIKEIIGEEDVMTRVRMIYQYDKLRGLLKQNDSLSVI